MRHFWVLETALGLGSVATLIAASACSSGGTGNTSGADAAVAHDAPAGDSVVVDTYDEFQVHNLDVVNMYRAKLNIAPLVLDHKLCAFALAGSTELSMDHAPHEHFINALNDNSIWQAGFSMDGLAENQGDPNGWAVISPFDPRTNELSQIDATVLYMYNEGPGTGDAHDHYTNMMDAQYKRLGVGLLEVADQLYLTNDFSN